MFLSVIPDASGTINFHNRSSMIAMKPTNSVLRVNTASKIIGWNLESIVRDFGNNASTSWVETYTDGVVVSTVGGSARTNLLYATSNAVNAGGGGLTVATSNALLALIRDESNTLLYLNNNNSNAIIANAVCCRVNSNALLYLNKNTSNTELRLFKNNSDAIISNAVCCRVNSNALLYLVKNLSNTQLRLFQNNSQEIVVLSTFFGGNLIIGGPTFTMTRQVFVSVDSTVTVTGNTTLFGNGHAFDFAKDGGNFSIDAGKSLLLTNVVLRNFAADSITLGAGASVTFGEGTCIELESMQGLTTNMTFSGSTLIQGFGNKIMMNDAVISVLAGGRLTLQDLFIDGLKSNNIQGQTASSSVKFKNVIMCLSSDFTFDTGRILFEMDVRLVGTNTFNYRPTNVDSKILECSRLFVDTGVTINYSPATANRDLLGMADQSSVLYLNGCTVRSTTTGMRLTNGKLVVDHKNQFFNTGATSPSQAIAFGNGTAANDLSIEMMPGGKIQLQSGQLAYQNTN